MDSASAAKAQSRVSRLTAHDFEVAFGLNQGNADGVNRDVADAFARVWAEDETTLKYDGTVHGEVEAPPSKDSRAAAGWLPNKPDADGAFVAPHHAFPYDKEGEDELFEAYGASYPEAYAVAVALEFHEAKPMPIDDARDVTGLSNSILHPPSGDPILLGTILIENTNDDPTDAADAKVLTEEDEPTSQASLTVGRRIVRYVLLCLAAGAVAVAGLYFAGLWP